MEEQSLLILSPYAWKEVPITIDVILKLVDSNKYISCFLGYRNQWVKTGQIKLCICYNIGLQTKSRRITTTLRRRYATDAIIWLRLLCPFVCLSPGFILWTVTAGQLDSLTFHILCMYVAARTTNTKTDFFYRHGTVEWRKFSKYRL